MSIKKTKQKLHSEQVKQKIITVAKELFSQYGFEKVSVRDIAEAADTTTGTLYYYFKNKDAILDAAYEKESEAFSEALGEKVRQIKDVDLIEYFFCELMVQQIYQDGLSFTSHRVFVQKKHSDVDSRYHHTVLDMVKREMEKGRFRRDLEAEEIAGYLLLVYRATVMEWCYAKGKFELKENMLKNIKFAINGLK